MNRIPDKQGEVRQEELCQTRQAEWRTGSLEEKLKGVIRSLPSSGVTLAEIRDLVGQDGLLILTILLTIVFMVPISIPGVSTVFGGAILLIGISRFFGCTLWLPKAIAQRVLPSDKLRAGLNKGTLWLHRLERVSRPRRLRWLVSGGLTDTLSNGALIIGAVLLMAPFGLIPFSNSLPALALLFLSIGLLQRDGLFILLGYFTNVATFVYFGILLAGGYTAVYEVFRHIVGKAS